jgi:hypothetical protein
MSVNGDWNMENKYTNEERVVIQKNLTLPNLYVTILKYRKMFAVPELHQSLFKDNLEEYIIRNRVYLSNIETYVKDIFQVLFGELDRVPLFINMSPDVVALRLQLGK